MKLFFASDIHGCLFSAKRMINAFEQSAADYLLLLGDVLNHGPRNPLPKGYAPMEVAELLNQYADKIIAVRGNCDSEVDQALLSFPMMADYNLVLLPTGQRIFLTHGHIYNGDNPPPLRKGDIIASGHTHLPVAQWQGDYIIFNPGSVAIPRNDYPASFGLLQDNRLSVLSFTSDELAMLDLSLC
ncbi:phosphodiesterase [Shewanella aestuarii]|uniref:Phosphoesterase n=1 Tax=Shewanella aestuarii TaxID=1028752 RepID=A0A6G9QH45_9GAMM|nr:phosphodiesterase [Shewanella aestuarii]QIR13387.1 phosphodiesterase [Shewanella aestuarii]